MDAVHRVDAISVAPNGPQATVWPRLEHLPQWFVAGFAVVYLSGYLIDFYFSSGIGVISASADALKLKYIQTGLSFLIFVVLLSGPSFYQIVDALLTLFWRALSPSITKDIAYQRYTRGFISSFTIIYTISIYSAVIFTPWHYFDEDPSRIVFVLCLIFGVQIIYITGTAIIDRCLKSYENKRTDVRSPRMLRRTIWMIGKNVSVFRSALAIILSIAIITVFDPRIFDGLSGTFFECLIDRRGVIFFVWCVLLGILIYRAVDRSKNMPIPPIPYIVVMALSLIVIFYLTLVSYAYSIFPYIPSVKGGADFTNAPIVQLTFDKSEPGSERETISDLIEVYATATTLYFARPADQSDPCSWRARRSKPKIIQAERSSVRKVEVTLEQWHKAYSCQDH